MNKEKLKDWEQLDILEKKLKIRELLIEADRDYWFAIYNTMAKAPCECVDPKKNPGFIKVPGGEINACSSCQERIKEFERVWEKINEALGLLGVRIFNPLTGYKNYEDINVKLPLN